MSFVSHLFWPWGMFVQIAALIHFFKRRPEWYWFWVILFFGAVGSAVYIVAEVIPDAGLARQGFQRYGRRSRIAVVEATVRDNPSVANLEELGELYWDQREYAKAKEVYDRAIATRADSSRTFYRRGQCEMALGDYVAAVPDLEEAIRGDAKTDNYRGEMLLAQAYAAAGRMDDANAWFADAVKRSSTPEVLFSYAEFLASQNRTDEAREWLTQLQEKHKSAPRYVQRVERVWFRKGGSLFRRLKKNASPAAAPAIDHP
ncbi:MAG TPA: tetratricopeptide repeat protein [Candidatus Acidoferrales bacterium]|nr:tetratricopeptide repeat protein [Candidatus Acidoferrales bacterium]